MATNPKNRNPLPTHTPERVPLRTGNQSGGEYNNTHGSTPNRTPNFDRGVFPQNSGTGKK